MALPTLDPATYSRPPQIEPDPNLIYKERYKFSRMNTVAREGVPFFGENRCTCCVSQGSEACWVHYKTKKTCRSCMEFGLKCDRPKSVRNEPSEPPIPAPRIPPPRIRNQLKKKDTGSAGEDADESGPSPRKRRAPAPEISGRPQRRVCNNPSVKASSPAEGSEDGQSTQDDDRDAALREFWGDMEPVQETRGKEEITVEVKRAVENLPELSGRVVGKTADEKEEDDEMVIRDLEHAKYLASVWRRIDKEKE